MEGKGCNASPEESANYILNGKINLAVLANYYVSSKIYLFLGKYEDFRNIKRNMLL